MKKRRRRRRKKQNIGTSSEHFRNILRKRVVVEVALFLAIFGLVWFSLVWFVMMQFRRDRYNISKSISGKTTYRHNHVIFPQTMLSCICKPPHSMYPTHTHTHLLTRPVIKCAFCKICLLNIISGKWVERVKECEGGCTLF